MDPVDLGAVEPASEKTFSHDFTIPETHVSSQTDDKDIVISYSLLVNVEPDVTFFRSAVFLIGVLPRVKKIQTQTANVYE